MLDIVRQTKLIDTLGQNNKITLPKYPVIAEDIMKKTFYRNTIKDVLSDEEIIQRMVAIKDSMQGSSALVVNAIINMEQVEISKLFLSGCKELEQYYNWCTGMVASATLKEGAVKFLYDMKSGTSFIHTLDDLAQKAVSVVEKCIHLHDAKEVKPGLYDVVCDSDLTGLIAHEAFGHGVEMDMFVKNRAKAIGFIDERVASDIVDMYDGANVFEEVSSYFFDDEGVLAHHTHIIEKGILKNGMNDLQTAMSLGVTPTGNGKRESYERKAYTRMTNTYFAKGTSTVEEMIASIDHGYLICGAYSGMEDPKNWGIQCIASYGIEIEHGQLTDRYIAPVVITGYVPDLLMSISMVSNEIEMFGTGFCGKGYKEWVKVSEGGPYLKAKVRLG